MRFGAFAGTDAVGLVWFLCVDAGLVLSVCVVGGRRSGNTLPRQPPYGMVDLGKSILATALLCASCAVMMCAWYLHLRYETRWSMQKAILLSWLIAGGEYCLQVPANRVGTHARAGKRESAASERRSIENASKKRDSLPNRARSTERAALGLWGFRP